MMSNLHKRKFFDEVNQIYALHQQKDRKNMDFFDYMVTKFNPIPNDPPPNMVFHQPDSIVQETKTYSEASAAVALISPEQNANLSPSSEEKMPFQRNNVEAPKSEAFVNETNLDHEDTMNQESVASSNIPVVSFGGPDTSFNSSTFSVATLDDSINYFPSLYCPPTQGNAHTMNHKTITSLAPESKSISSLMDYYDTDNYTELIPCYLFYKIHCSLHDTNLSHPYLLFCIQVLDQFLSSNSNAHAWTIKSCQIARVVFASLWSKRHQNHQKDIDIRDYTERGKILIGVTTPVWQIISDHWNKYKASLLHSDEFYVENQVALTLATNSRHVTKDYYQNTNSWLHSQDKLNIYGIKREIANSDVDVQALSPVGAYYLNSLPNDASNRTTLYSQRMYVPLESMSFAFKQLEANLRGFDSSVMLYPMGTFARGGCFLSVLDVLLLPTKKLTTIDQVTTALLQVNILEDKVRSVTPHRLIAPIRFKHILLLLDLKFYAPPKAFAAMIYFTGPESYVQFAFRNVLAECEADTRFETIFTKLTEKYGPTTLNEIIDEHAMCTLLGLSTYQDPRYRF
ncbi:hypothetical protein THRCLA_11247 [Thraustotheca clavata]|uniref:Uncharacterized protein n=1 Tax=Thraustotheca clavata TaxID=74557 RepID=A0A1V9Y8B1_9STRA|nr:hypothetical protein THRCLA_11247 [Thraustotheca clavata]